MQKIRKGDSIIVIAGKDKGKRGQVLQIINPDKVLIENINIFKKHTKPNPSKNIVGGILDKSIPINISNIAIYNPDTKRADRVGIRLEKDTKVRFFKSNNKLIK